MINSPELISIRSFLPKPRASFKPVSYTHLLAAIAGSVTDKMKGLNGNGEILCSKKAQESKTEEKEQKRPGTSADYVALGSGIFMSFCLYLLGNILGSLPGFGVIPGLAWTIILGIIIKFTGLLPDQFADNCVYSMNFALRALLPMPVSYTHLMVEEAEVPARWADIEIPEEKIDENLPKWIRKIQLPVNAMKGDNIPVSDFTDLPDGTMPQGTSKYEKRGIAVNIPVWDSAKCIQCNMCSYVCPHSCIRPFLVNEDEAAKAPKTFTTTDVKGKGAEGLRFRLQVSALDCTGCGLSLIHIFLCTF